MTDVYLYFQSLIVYNIVSLKDITMHDYCTYCGDWFGEDKDHVILIAFKYSGKRGTKSYRQDKNVPACRECNVLLGSKAFFTVQDRASFLAKKLANRYKALLYSQDWEDKDLQDLGHNLRGFIEQSRKMRQNVANRIAHCQLVATDKG